MNFACLLNCFGAVAAIGAGNALRKKRTAREYVGLRIGHGTCWDLTLLC